MMRAAELRHKAGIRMGSFAPDSVVHMGRHDGDAKFRFAGSRKQSSAIESAPPEQATMTRSPNRNKPCRRQ
ncbi:MAG: hypothetical protein ACLRX3_10740 [Subdoligranulum sp.]